MRTAVGILTSALTLFVAGAFGLWGTWALAVASVLGLIGATVAVTVLEERENAETIAEALADRRRPTTHPLPDLARRAV